MSVWNFADELAKYGPGSPAAATTGRSRDYCEYVARSHYENFTVVSWLLPRELRPHFNAVYAWCRWADDLADETQDSPALLAWWRHELTACYGGEPRHPITLALWTTVEEFGIPQGLFIDLLTAFEQDQTKREYDTYEELESYCRHSANPVGRIVLHLFGAKINSHVGMLSDWICTGLQLANFWQDVARDFAIDRIYIPREDRRRFGYWDEDFAAHRCNESFRKLMKHEVDRARELLRLGRKLVVELPRKFRTDVALFADGGLAILDAIERQDYDVWRERPEVSKFKKIRLLARCLPGLILR